MVLKYLLLLFGLFEIITNLYHLSKKSAEEIGKSAKRQHQEISLSLPNVHFFYKVIIMLVFGFVFFTASIIGFSNAPFSSTILAIVTISFGFYGLLQALIYNGDLKVWLSAVAYNIPLLLYFFL